MEHEYAATPAEDRREVSVLTPGCGLGRLPFEIARAGFNSVGNEFSYHMLTASNYLLNATERVGQHEIAPFIHSLSNHHTDSDMFRRILIPDVVPSDVLQNASFSMAAGEFIDCFSDQESASQFDCVVTCFFLDTAHNIVEYIEVISNVLKSHGLWINLGPCLWHHEHGQGRENKLAFDEDGEYIGSIELSMEESMALIERMGFQIESKEVLETPYMGNERGMLEHIYHAQLFTARLAK